MKSESEVTQSCLTLSDPMDYSLPGSSVHGIFQARVLEWSAIAFSGTPLGRFISMYFTLSDEMVRSDFNLNNKILSYEILLKLALFSRFFKQ